MYMCSIWISYTITVLSVFNADLVVGQINNVLTGTRYNITIDFNPNDTAIFWIRDSTNLRDARVDTTTGYGCRSPLNFAPSRFNFYCENYGGRYILELDSSTDDKGIIYTTDTPSSPTFQYEVIDNDHTDAITCTNISAGFQLNETFTLTLSCTVTCTLQDTSITVYAKQNDTISPQLNTTSKIDACSSIGFQTITESSNLTLHVVRSLNITEQFTVVFNISHRGQFITRETSVITVSPDPTTIPIENTTVTQSSISQTSTSGATTSSDSSSSTPLSSSSLPSTSQQVTTNGASTTSNTPPPEDLSDEMLAVIIASSVGFILLVVIIFFIVFCVVIRKRKRNPQKVQHPGDHSYSNKGYNYNRRPDMHSSESNQQSRHTPRQMNIAEFQRQDHLHGPALTGSPHGHYPVYQLHNYPSKSEYKQSSRNKSSATKHNASSRRDPRSDKYRDPNKNYNYVDRNSDLNQEYYIRPYAGGYPLRSGDYRYYR